MTSSKKGTGRGLCWTSSIALDEDTGQKHLTSMSVGEKISQDNQFLSPKNTLGIKTLLWSAFGKSCRLIF